MKPHFSIIIVNFNTKDLLDECLSSLSKDESVEKEIIVIDNDSKDSSVEMVKKKYKDVKLIENQENLGFAKANNQGLNKATGDFILLLNSDTQLKSDVLSKMVEFAKNHQEAGVVGARLLNADGSIQPSLYHFPSIVGAMWQYWMGKEKVYEKYAAEGNSPVSVDAVVGAAMLIPKRTLNNVGLLDERYFMYFEDLDYCRRVKKAGFKVYYLPEAEIFHYHGASGKGSGKTYRYLVESSKIYNGLAKFWILNFVLWTGQKWQKLLGR
ncbi:MAG: glycosyltransferase family 2 protein [bacterium]|nr:glycosyltransferase family 2 protein [bacterium]